MSDDDRIEELDAEIERLRTAMRELLSGHDNLYRAHFGYLPTCNPENDIAAKAARQILAQGDAP